MKISKIKDTSLNLEIQGTGCWDDCYHGGHWELERSTQTEGCSWYGSYWDWITNPFS
ncbi:hypothetical protein PV797_05090 [Clostridiaceae bacterium M8S5]|nr:hypothetical protein PV797_05090 [Clostridiaceae bacterium M8S5]